MARRANRNESLAGGGRGIGPSIWLVTLALVAAACAGGTPRTGPSPSPSIPAAEEEEQEERWEGTLHSDTEVTYTVPEGGSCSNAWEAEFSFIVDQGRAVSGEGLATLSSPPRCTSPIPATAPQIEELPFEVEGEAHADRFELRFGAQPGGVDYGGFGLTVFNAGQTAFGPTLNIPRSGECTAEADISLENEYLTARGSSQTRIELECTDRG
jgi:hypothetical protein